ncbi:hypothetical protein GPJ56_000543 [Histomonas meleagridis]|uniref:uncharacterized protein n=1 Tax=Histomonas meleagridis TaxID=135588 RepID=UPI003559B5D5|nr:hypothetical protein GPJ56_000543 [Histomonas meleagridis]KAH0796417.1 hypothetical protein GO595_010310 [Histomonas meleagridis]
MDELRKSWKEHLAVFNRSKEIVNVQYDSLLARLDNIISSIEPKILISKQLINNHKTEIDSIHRSILRAQSVQEQQANDENSEKETEITLKHQLEVLKQKIDNSQKEIRLNTEKSNRYKQLYLAAVGKQRNIRERKKDLNRLNEVRTDFKRYFADFLCCINDEQKNLDKDIETLRKMREDVQNIKTAKENEEHIDSSDDIGPVNVSNNTNEVVFYGRNEIGGKNRKIQMLEENIQTLLSTGNYNENDPIIKNLKKKIEELMQ